MPLFIIEGGSHGPMHRRQGEDFSYMLKHAFEKAQMLAIENWTAHLPLINNELFELNYKSCFSIDETDRTIKAFYEDLLLQQKSITKSEVKDPLVYLIEGTSITVAHSFFDKSKLCENVIVKNKL